MPLFTRELNELADRIGRSALTCRLHTSAPTNGTPTNGRTNAGGGGYENGVSVPTGNISAASNGDISITGDIDFGTADEAVGTVTHWSLYRSTDAVAFGTLPSTAIANGDSFKINADSLDINGSTT